MGLREIMISIVIFGAIITGTSMFATSMGNTYNNTINSSYQDSYALLNQSSVDIEGIAVNISSKVETSAGVQSESNDLRLDKLLVAAIKLPYSAMKTVTTGLGEIGGQLGLPTWFVGTCVLLILLTIVFLILQAFARVPTGL